MSPDETLRFHDLSEGAQDVLQNIHYEYAQEVEIAVSEFDKKQSESDVVSHHFFLSDDKIHKTGYMLLEIQGDDWTDLRDDDLRSHGLSVADKKYAAKFSTDDNGIVSFESQATTNLGRAFEQDQLQLSADKVEQAIADKQNRAIEKAERDAEKLAQKNGFTIGKDGDQYALVPNSKIITDREDGLQSVFVAKSNRDDLTHFDSLAELKGSMKLAKALDEAENNYYQNQKLPMHVVSSDTMKHALKSFNKNPDAKVNVRTNIGEAITLQRNEDFSVSASGRNRMNAGQRVVVSGSREHEDAKQNSMIKHGIYIEKTADCYKVGHLDEAKPRYAEKTQGMAMRAAIVLKQDIDKERAIEAQKQAEKQKDSQDSNVMVAVG